ncbi:hypothetical protein QJQ45_023116 [Haematococcus lacustris]|nr:hypothetical protein QJQ45_023116 [Haematococcus lacustris]
MQQPNLPQLQAQLRLLLQARAQMQTSPMLARQGQPMQAFQPQAQQAVPTQLQPAQLFPMLQAPQNRTQASPTLALQGQPGTLALQALQPQAQQAVLHLFQAPQNQTQRPQTPSGTQLIQPQPLPSPRQSSTTSQSQSGKENKSTGGKIPERECQALTSTELSSPDVGFELRLEPVECASPHPEQPDILIVIDETLAVDVICHEHCAVEWQGPGPDSPTPSALGDEAETTCRTCGCSILPHWWAPLHKHSHDHEVFVFATSSVIISNFIFAQTLPILILIL